MKRTPLRRTGRLKARLTLQTKTDGTHKVWSNYILTRDRRTCQKCGRAAPQWKVDAAHILSKSSAPRLRYHLLNGVTLCFLCHRWYDQHKSTTHDGEADRWVQTWLRDRFPTMADPYMVLRVQKSVGPKVDAEIALLTIREATKVMIDRRAVLESLKQ